MEFDLTEIFRSALTVKILYQDKRVVAVHKPEGQLVIPGRGPATGLCLKEECANDLARGVFVVHRIDRETSGLVLFALDAESHRFLSRAFERREVAKEYRAVVSGAPHPADGFVDSPLRLFGSGRVAADPRGKPSRTDYATLARWADGALLSVRPLTGRQHQIRTHLAERGHPVFGDSLYGPAPRPVGGIPRLLLHAAGLKFPHPDGGERDLWCEPSDSFKVLLNVVSKSKIVYLGGREGTTQ